MTNHPNRNRKITSVATAMRGSDKHQKKFSGCPGDRVVKAWLRSIDAKSATVRMLGEEWQVSLYKQPWLPDWFTDGSRGNDHDV